MSVGISASTPIGPILVKDLIAKAYLIAHVLGKGESLSLVKALDGFESLNDLIEQATICKTFSPYQTEIAVPMQTGQLVYTVGPSTVSPPPDVTAIRPVEVLSGYSRRIGQDLPVFITHAKQDYDYIQNKNLHSLGWNGLVYYQATYPAGTLYVYPMPGDTLTTLHLTVLANIAPFLSLEDEVSLPPGYYQYLKYDLAKRVCADHGQTFGPENADILDGCKAALEGNNLKPFPVAGTGIAGLSSWTTGYNIISDNMRPF